MTINCFCLIVIMSIVFIAFLIHEGIKVVKIFNYSFMVWFGILGIIAMVVCFIVATDYIIWLSIPGGN